MPPLLPRLFPALLLSFSAAAQEGSGSGTQAPPAVSIPAGTAPGSPQAPAGNQPGIPVIQWEKITELPPRHGEPRNPGLAGAFAGAQGNVLIVAGGTNYPQGMPWIGGSRVISKDIYVLEQGGNGPDGRPAYRWLDPRLELPEGVSHGASVSLPEGVLCVGGMSAPGVRDACFLLSWNKAAGKVESTPFPKLPKPLTGHAAVALKGVVYVLGGTNEPGGKATNAFYALDLAKRGTPEEFQWKPLPAWDGPPRAFPVAAASVDAIYLCGGRDPGRTPDFLTDLHRFDPVKNDWSLLGEVVDRKGRTGYVMAAAAFHASPGGFVVVGGMDPDLTRALEQNAREPKDIDDAEREKRKKYGAELLEKFAGYPRSVIGYEAGAGEWSALGEFPSAVPLTNPAVTWGDRVVIPGGETGPGRRTPEIWAATIGKTTLPAATENATPGAGEVSEVPVVPTGKQAPAHATPGKPKAGTKTGKPKR